MQVSDIMTVCVFKQFSLSSDAIKGASDLRMGGRSPPNQIKRLPIVVMEATVSAQKPFTAFALKLIMSDKPLTDLDVTLPSSRASDVPEHVKVRTPCA